MNSSFHSIWNEVEAFKLDKPSEDAFASWCGYAREFHKWVNQYILVDKETNLISLNQAKLILLDKYLEWRSFVPKNHQDCVTVRGHVCIYHIFIRACEQLKVSELMLNKPMLFIPAPSPNPWSGLKGPMLFLGPVEE